MGVVGNVIEIRWHARGGQGAKTASVLLAEAAATAGKYIQGFPEYGPERMGAPMRAFNRISDTPIRAHSGVENPDVVIVLDPTLIGKTDVTGGLKPGGTVIVNTKKSPQEVRQRLKLDGAKIFTVDADGISVDTIGKVIPNTPMMGALLKATELMDLGAFLISTREKLGEKFRSKPEVIDGNIKAIERAYQEVQGE